MKIPKNPDFRLETVESMSPRRDVSRLMSHFSCLLLCVLCFASISHAAVEAIPEANGEIHLAGWSGSAEIYRDTSPLEGRDLADIEDIEKKHVATGQSAPFEDLNTTDGTKYYYRIDASGGPYFVEAIADKTPPAVENIAALPSPFSPGDGDVDIDGDGVIDGDGIDDTTKIFFTLTETTTVTLRVYLENYLDPGQHIRTLLEDEELPPGDNFVEWDGWNETLSGGDYAWDGRYIYRFEKADTIDTAGNTLIQAISGDVWILTTRFEIKDISVTPTPFSPDGDMIRDVAAITYEIVDSDPVDDEFSADYVAGNIFSISGGKQDIVASIYVECLDYYWDEDAGQWVSFHVPDGIRDGLSSEKYYLRPVDAEKYVEPPFYVSDPYPDDAETIGEYLQYYQADNPNWVPVPFTLLWDGEGAIEGVSTYIVRLEAVKASGFKTMPKTHEIIVEIPRIVPNDKTPPVVVSTFPPADSVYSPTEGLSYVQAYLSDGQGTGPDLVKSRISLLGPNGENIPGVQSNDGKDSITLRLNEALDAYGIDDGTYTIVVITVDYATNMSGELQFQFEYNTSINDDVLPYITGLPVAVDADGGETEISNGTVIELIAPETPPDTRSAIHSIRVQVCDDQSGMNLSQSSIQLARIVGPQEEHISGEKVTVLETRNCGRLIFRLSESLDLEGQDDGTYRLRVTSVDLAGNENQGEFVFTYRTVEDVAGPTVDAVSLIGDGDTVLAQSAGVSPFALGAVAGPVNAIYASVSDPDPSAGLYLDVSRSYIILTGPSGVVSGQISYAREGRTEDSGTFADIVFTIDVPLVKNDIGYDHYDVNIVVEDTVGNDKGQAVASFDVLNALAAEDTEPPLITDVEVIREQGIGSGEEFGPVCLGKYPYVSDATGVQVTLLDEKAGVDTQISHVKVIEPDVRLLFEIETSTLIEDDLDDGILHADLQQAFIDNGITLSGDATVLVEVESQRWLVEDQGDMYTVRREQAGMPALPVLRIYERHIVNGGLAAEPGVEPASVYLIQNWPVPLSINGWYIVEVFAVDNTKMLLFGIDLADYTYPGELDNRIVSEDLRQEFEGQGNPLSGNVTVTVRDAGYAWLITDRGLGKLDIYGAGACKWRSIDGQQTYIVERKVWRDPATDEIMSKLEVYLSNATTVQVPNAFYFDNVPPAIDPNDINVKNDGQPIQIQDTQFDSVSAEIVENGSGLDYGATSIVVKDEDGFIMPGSLVLSLEEENGDIKVIAEWLLEEKLSLYTPYTLEVRTKDLAGNETFLSLDLRTVTARGQAEEPKVTFVFPDAGEFRDMEDDEIKVFGPIIDRVTVRIEDTGNVGVDLAESSVKVLVPVSTDPYWWDIEGYQTYDEDAVTITWNFKQSLPTDGRADGEYRVIVRVRDNNGLTRRFTSSFKYDSDPPEVVDVKMGSGPVQGLMSIDTFKVDAGLRPDFIATDETLNIVSVELKDDLAGPDLFESSVEIIGPHGALDVSQRNDGVDTLIIEFPPLSTDGQDDGIYQINITAVDNVGNQTPFPDIPPYSYTFIYDTQAPQIICALACIGDEPAEFENVPLPAPPEPIFGDCLEGDPGEKPRILSKLDRVKVKLGDAGVGINLLSPAVRISVTGPHGPVKGRKAVEDNMLVFIFDSPLSTTDSLDDGDYTVEIEAVDLIGNSTELEFVFEYKALAPVLVDIQVVTDDGEVFSLMEEEYKKLERSVVEVRAVIQDRSGKGLNFEESFMVLEGPGVSTVEDTLSNNEADTIIYTFKYPLASDGSDDGKYRVFVRAIDNDGHWMDYLAAFFFDNTPPEVISVTPDAIESRPPTEGDIPIPALRGPLSEVSVRMFDEFSGVDLFESKVELSAPVDITWTQINDGVDTITLRFFRLPQNGTADGLYEISVLPVDKLGNEYPEPLIYRFIYDNSPPVVISTRPADSQLVTVPVDRVVAILSDGKAGESAGVDLDASAIKVEGPDGQELPGTLQRLDVADIGAEEGASPLIVLSWDSVLREDPQTGTLYYVVTGEIQNISETLKEEVRVNVSSYDANGVLVNTKSTIPFESEKKAITTTGIVRPQATLTPENVPPGEVATFVIWIEKLGGEESFKVKPLHYAPEEEGEEEELPEISVLAYVLDQQLAIDGVDDGTYTIKILTRDEIGNVSPVVSSSFTYSTISPEVLSTRPPDGAALSTPVSSVKVTLKDKSGAGLDLTASKVKLIGPDGGIVPGTHSSQGIDTIVYTLEHVLATDGSADGLYTLDILAVDSSGISASYRTTFIYDRTPPVVRLTFPADGDEVKEGVGYVSAQIEDVGAGVDLEGSSIELEGPDGAVTGVQVNDGVDTISWILDTGYSMLDGKYTIKVTPKDKVGNTAFLQTFGFIYDAAAPVVSSQPEEGSTVVYPLNRVSAQLDDGNGTGVDLEASEIHLYGPDDQEISSLRKNGVDTLILTFPTLAIDGSANGAYTISVIAQDKIGNGKEYSFQFEYLPTAPGLLSMKPADGSSISKPIERVEARLDNKSGAGIDFGRSLIKLLNPLGEEVKGRMSHNGVDTMFFILQNLFATDGRDDGQYTVEVMAVDNDGYESPVYSAKFTYDTTPPELVGTVPESGAILNSISEVSAKLADATTQVDLFDSKIDLKGPVSVAAMQVNDGVDTISLKFFELPADGSVDGLYQVSVSPVDVLGNKHPEPLASEFVYDTRAPKVVSTKPSEGELVTARFDQVSVVLSDGKAGESAGVDLSACVVKLIGPDGEEIAGESVSEGMTIDLRLDTEDLTLDGTYTIQVTTKDLIGNVSIPVMIDFTFVTRAPAVSSMTPANGAQFRAPVSQVAAKLLDNSGAGLDLEKSVVTLVGPDGEVVPGEHSSVEPNEIRLDVQKLATDGTDDGSYTMRILAVDKTGVSFNYETTFVFDTASPLVKLTSPADGSMMRDNISYVSAKLEDAGSGVDLEGSIIGLEGPDGAVAGTQVNDGVDTIIYKFVSLPGDGEYTISVVPVDMIGNALPEPQTFSFAFDTTAPVVVKTVPVDGSIAVVSIASVEVELKDDVSGVDLSKSRIQLFGPDGIQIPGVRNDADSTLALTFPALGVSGEDDGEYTITVVAQDKVGNVLEDASLKFTYLPTAPVLVAMTPEAGSFISKPLLTVVVEFGDRSGSGIDFDNSWINLLDPDGESVSGWTSNDGADKLMFRLENPFANDGSADGMYTAEIRAADNKGNAATYEAAFSLDTTPAAVSAVYIGDLEVSANATIVPSDLGLVTRISAVLNDAGAGVDVNSSVMSLDGVEAVLTNDGVDTIDLRLETSDLRQDGIYTLRVNPVDKLGNKPPKDTLFRFMIDTTAPKVASSTPADGSSVVNASLSQIKVQLDDGAGSGLDVGMTTVQVSGPNGEVSGELVVADGALVYDFEALSMDGLSDGDYVVVVSFADMAGNMGESSLSFSYDTVQPGGPVISSLGVFPRAFSPNGDGVYDTTTISYVLSKDAVVRLLVYDSGKALAAVLADSEQNPTGTNSVVWDGAALADGAYTIKIDAVDDRGLTGAVESAGVGIDTHPPSVDKPVVSNNPFTPDGDGFADTTTISFAVSGSEKVEVGSEPRDNVAVSIYYDSPNPIASLNLSRPFDGDGEYSATWDGAGASVDGEYGFVITARDVAGNFREISGTVALDKGGPIIQVLKPLEPSSVHSRSPIVLSGTATDWSGVRSMSLTGSFTPHRGTEPIANPISNWVQMTFSGDKIDNDSDGSVDEEEFNDKDDDGDGLVDEDLAGKDEISDPVEWIYRLVPPSDGQYSITFRALDSINHSTVAERPLKLVYDATPPAHVGTRHAVSDVQVQSVKNGDDITIVTTWDEPDYEVMVDLTQLDSASSGLVKADDRGDGTYVVEHTVSSGNSRPDGLKVIVITAEDAVGNKTTLSTFRIRLRNNLPVIVSVSSPDGRTSFRDGDLVKILVRCDAADLVVSADFGELDSTYSPGKVRATNNGDMTYTVQYSIGADNAMADRVGIPVIIAASDGTASVSYRYEVSLDNAAPQVQLVRIQKDGLWYDGVPATSTSGETLMLETVWDGSDYTVSADFSAVDSTYRSGAEQVAQSDSTYTILYEISSSNAATDGEKAVIITAVDAAGNRGQAFVTVNLDNTAPDILSVASEDKTLFKNGDTVTLLVKLDGPGYIISGDFSELDSTYPDRVKEVSVSDKGDGTYIVKYTISKDNTKALSGTVSGIRITVTAADSVGNVSSDSSVTVELDNFPPKLELEGPTPSTKPAALIVTVTEARIQVKGETEPDAKVTVEPRGTIGVSPEASVGADGKFSALVALNVGKNTIRVTATDTAGNQTLEDLTILYRPLIRAVEGGEIYLPEKRDDGIEGNDTRVVVPAGAVGQDISIEIKPRELESVSPAMDNPDIGRGSILPLAAYEFVVKDRDGQLELSMAFLKPITVHLQYQDLDKLGGPAMVFKWDGVRWNMVGGVWNESKKTVEIRVNALSVFAIFQVADVPKEFRLAGAYPNPFTPNDDLVNDEVTFYFDNPNNADAVIRIYDLRGVLVRKLENGLTSWDGLDDESQPAEMGVYIYQIEVEGIIEGNTIVLAR